MKFVSEDSLRGRINQKLANRFQKIRKPRPAKMPQLGPYYVQDTRDGFIMGKNIELETFGRKLGVLREAEGLTAAKLASKAGD